MECVVVTEHKWKSEVVKVKGRNPFLAVAAHTNGHKRELERCATEAEALALAKKEVRKLNSA